ncbi:hypothetical protein CVT24_004277 [Panaeolus cyanescens]|uniref:Uncharacterized protein n=1 Tax=Panaeolus cyanescens TaxID=181874 RepID=A0A409VEL0_9AGAR|nr:hypothetical protein CVT24_004277 [Panaeolus cyanescens]
MDELLHHCLRELAFDGELGPSRLKDFIVDFYTSNNASSHTLQNADDAFCSFVWSLMVQQPSVMVGLTPIGISSEVWIAPQISAKRKAKGPSESPQASTPPSLEPLSVASTPLPELQKMYGERLRVAVEPDAIFCAITGSHIRSAKMSPMVYSALQIITRGRDAGVTVVDLGKQTGYDQKTCFYLVRQLIELDLIVKVRRGGVGTHFCIHKYFFERNASWKAIRDEEIEAEESLQSQNLMEEDDKEEDDVLYSHEQLNFTPIDARHLSSLPLISSRVIKLLKASKNHIHASNNMLITLGFSNPTKTDRRFFQSRIREMIQQRLIEKVIVPSNKKKSVNASVKCFRLVEDDALDVSDVALTVLQPADDVEDFTADSQGGVKMNTTVHRQIIELLEESGTTGMTLNVSSHFFPLAGKLNRMKEIATSLSQFDKRTIELLLARADKYHPPPHLTDLAIAGLMETKGRERRHRYFTLANYRKLVDKESLDKNSTGLRDITLHQAGGFFPIPSDCFYDNEQELVRYSDGFKEKDKNSNKKDRKTKEKKSQKRKNGAETVEELDDEDKQAQQDVVVSQPGEIILQNVSRLSDRSKARKRGRPRKHPVQPQPESDSWTPSQNANEVLNQPDAPPCVAELLPGPKAVSDAQEQLLSNTKQASPPPSSLMNGNSDNVAVHETMQREETPRLDAQLSEGTSAGALNGVHPESQKQTATRVNVSQLRRENELLRLVENNGGILNIQTKEFYDSHMKLLETMAQAGEATSAPVGTRTDKRTITSTFESLERKKRVKVLKTSVPSYTGSTRPACVIYLPETDEQALNDFLADLSKGTHYSVPQLSSFVKIDQPVEYGADTSSSSRGTLPLQLLQVEQPGTDDKERWTRNLDRARQLFAYDDKIIREVFLTERTTLGQLYGFIVGRALRCRKLHLTALSAFEFDSTLPHVVSGDLRIIDISYFCHDLNVTTYTQLVSPLSHDEELLTLIRSESGMTTPVRDLPPRLHAFCQIGRSRAKTRILDMLQVLYSLGLALPLRPTTTESPYISCPSKGEYPTAFSIAPQDGWTVNTPHSAPMYWQFCRSAPLHIWALSETSPPYWKTADVTSATQAEAFWTDLRNACSDAQLEVVASSELQPTVMTLNTARSLRRAVSWKSDYFLTWHQTQYLKQFVRSAPAWTPLQIIDDEERGDKLSHISWVVSAPQHVVVDFFSNAHKKLLKHLEKLERKQKTLNKKGEDSKLSMARKAEEARARREKEWGDLLQDLSLEASSGSAAVRLDGVKTRFLQAGSVKDTAKWEREIQAALREADLANSKRFRMFRPQSQQQVPRSATSSPPPPSSVGSQPATPTNYDPTSIQALILSQGPPINHERTSKKRHRKSHAETAEERPTKRIRRHRFQWNADYDELARDASVIIRARCRQANRLDWAAFEQVFPAVLRNTVRQHLDGIKETPGNEAYLRRLEDAWYDLWLKHRGTADLPDDNVESPSNFDLIKHIEFLRAHIDKNALRVGFDHAVTLPEDVVSLEKAYDITENEPTAPLWDYMWNALIEEGREKKMKTMPFSKFPEEFPGIYPTEPDEIVLAESALKMAMGTPPEHYDSVQASALLKSRGDAQISAAIQGLLLRGVLSKTQRDPSKHKPGRQLKISENNQNAIGGNIAREVFQDSTALLEAIDPNDNSWHEWPLTATDGDCATLIQLVSENKVVFNVDTSVPQTARIALDWNSKKADDDQIETAISVRYHSIDLRQDVSDKDFGVQKLETSSEVQVAPAELSGDHGRSSENKDACCGLVSQGLVDCIACLHGAWWRLRNSLDGDIQSDAGWLIEMVKERGAEGLSKNELTALSETRASRIPRLVSLLTEGSIPQLYWTGYETPVLVSAYFIGKWSVTTCGDTVTYVFPRRWLDIRGIKVPDYWQAALRAVVGLVVFRPGISQAEIRWRLRAVYDSQEINEILNVLQSEDYLEARYTFSSDWLEEGVIVPMTNDEERQVQWVLGSRPWYQI